ncbi:hypothetical protein CKF54_03310 [Psittacicella hinzii]|uniref:Uncharacterized protein n=1 Tax=Psittacicella hinzii TaxID=2028575 RepID=A0A3A1Y4R6_9GAMM|nr:hypothetical protein [Psittacicella hinzii]RIY33233.1 hypothetical protein CKF54_03310 [Psittacicella hinzii]
MFNNLFDKASSMLNAAQGLKDLDLSNPSQLLDQIKTLDFDQAKDKLQSLLPTLNQVFPISAEQVTSLLDKLGASTANKDTIVEIVEKVKSLLSSANK